MTCCIFGAKIPLSWLFGRSSPHMLFVCVSLHRKWITRVGNAYALTLFGSFSLAETLQNMCRANEREIFQEKQIRHFIYKNK